MDWFTLLLSILTQAGALPVQQPYAIAGSKAPIVSDNPPDMELQKAYKNFLSNQKADLADRTSPRMDIYEQLRREYLAGNDPPNWSIVPYPGPIRVEPPRGGYDHAPRKPLDL